MMTTILSIILLAIFTALSLMHFYWLFGGKWGLEKVIPTKENQTSTLSIPKFATLIVALVLILFRSYISCEIGAYKSSNSKFGN